MFCICCLPELLFLLTSSLWRKKYGSDFFIQQIYEREKIYRIKFVSEFAVLELDVLASKLLPNNIRTSIPFTNKQSYFYIQPINITNFKLYKLYIV